MNDQNKNKKIIFHLLITSLIEILLFHKSKKH